MNLYRGIISSVTANISLAEGGSVEDMTFWRRQVAIQAQSIGRLAERSCQLDELLYRSNTYVDIIITETMPNSLSTAHLVAWRDARPSTKTHRD
jgi:hypothetical protein